LKKSPLAPLFQRGGLTHTVTYPQDRARPELPPI